jgi:hypothetical protein
MPQFSDDLFLGSAQSFVGTNSNNNFGNPSPIDLGFGPMARVYLYDIVPVAASVNSILGSVTPTGATTYSGSQLAAASATNGTTSVTLADGTQVLQWDYPRCVSVVTGTGTFTNSLVTISGYDYYGQAMSEIIQSGTVASTTTQSRKAFFQVSSIAFSAATTSSVSVGTNKTFGLPAKVTDPAYVLTAKFSAGAIDNTSGVTVGLGGGNTFYSKQVISSFSAATPGVVTLSSTYPYSPPSGTLVQFTGSLGTLTGVSLNTTYWWTFVSTTTGKISTTQANYLAGTFVATGGTTITSGINLVPLAVSSPTTPDVRGTYVVTGTPDGTKRLLISMGLTANQVGPNSTRTSLLGIDQA